MLSFAHRRSWVGGPGKGRNDGQTTDSLHDGQPEGKHQGKDSSQQHTGRQHCQQQQQRAQQGKQEDRPTARMVTVFKRLGKLSGKSLHTSEILSVTVEMKTATPNEIDDSSGVAAVSKCYSAIADCLFQSSYGYGCVGADYIYSPGYIRTVTACALLRLYCRFNLRSITA